MFSTRQVALGYLLPFLFAAVLPFLRTRLTARMAGFATTLGIGLAMLGGLIAVEPWPGFWPHDTWGWAHVGALVAALLGTLEAAGLVPARARSLVQLLLAELLVALIVRPLIPHVFSPDGAGLRVLGVGLGLAVVWAALDVFAEHERGPALPAVLTVLGLGLCVSIVLSGSLRLAQMGFVGVALAAGLALGSMIRKDTEWRGVSVAAPLIAWAALALDSTFYGGLPEASVALLAAAPMLAWATRLGPLQRLGVRWRALVAASLVAIPTAVAVVLAFRQAPSFAG